MIHRREFLASAGGGFVTLLLTPLINACSSSDSSGTTTSTGTTTLPPSGCDGSGETSSVSAGHAHTLCVPASDLSSPPAAGVTYATSITDGHDHGVTLSQAQLMGVASGGTVVVTTTTVSGHTHDFAVKKTVVATTPSPPPPAMGYSMY